MVKQGLYYRWKPGPPPSYEERLEENLKGGLKGGLKEGLKGGLKTKLPPLPPARAEGLKA